jgi:hypothetical protein
VAGAQLTNTTAASLLPASAIGWLSPDDLGTLGNRFWFRAIGKASTVVTTPGTLTLDHRLGVPGSGIIVFTSQAMNLNIVAKSDVTWIYESFLTITALGSGTSAKIMGCGWFMSEALVGSPVPTVGGAGMATIPNGPPADGTGFDGSGALQHDFYGKFSVNDASVKMTCLASALWAMQ